MCQGGEKRHQSYIFFFGGGGRGKEVNPCTLNETNKHILNPEQISPEQQIKSMLTCGDNGSFCHVKAKQSEERSCVSQHSFSCASQQRVSTHTDRLKTLLESLASLSWTT